MSIPRIHTPTRSFTRQLLTNIWRVKIRKCKVTLTSCLLQMIMYRSYSQGFHENLKTVIFLNPENNKTRIIKSHFLYLKIRQRKEQLTQYQGLMGRMRIVQITQSKIVLSLWMNREKIQSDIRVLKNINSTRTRSKNLKSICQRFLRLETHSRLKSNKYNNKIAVALGRRTALYFERNIKKLFQILIVICTL